MSPANKYRAIKSFSEINFMEHVHNIHKNIVAEIAEQKKEYILNVNEGDYKAYLLEKHSLEPLSIEQSKEIIHPPSKSEESKIDSSFGNRYMVDVYQFDITYPYSGDETLFQMKPSPYVMNYAEIFVDERKKEVTIRIKTTVQDASRFEMLKNQMYGKAFINLPYINKNIVDYMAQLPSVINDAFRKQREKHIKENEFFAAINVKIDPTTEKIFHPPTIQKKIIPQPTIPKGKELASEPGVTQEIYADILKVIYDLGKGMENKPSLYKGKDEEELRDHFLVFLETRYEAITASGETFNKGGKTDIILKYSGDGSNLFVAECKVWHGGSEFQKAITQLFDRYLTWRDSKVALIFFVKSKDFSKTLLTIKEEVSKHPYFVRDVGVRGESSFCYHFHLPQDKDKIVHTEIIAFHFID